MVMVAMVFLLGSDEKDIFYSEVVVVVLCCYCG